MAGLPKKYARMGFKKGWAAFRARKKLRSSSAPISRRAKRKQRRSVNFMAKRRGGSRRSSRRMKGLRSPMAKAAVYGGLYGLVREPLNQLSRRLPVVGGMADELGLLAVSGAAAYWGSGAVRAAGLAGMTIEAHNLTRNLKLGSLATGLGFSTAPSLSNDGVVII